MAVPFELGVLFAGVLITRPLPTFLETTTSGHRPLFLEPHVWTQAGTDTACDRKSVALTPSARALLLYGRFCNSRVHFDGCPY